MASPARPLYNTIFRKNYVFLGVVFAAAFGFEMGFDVASDKLWDRFNKGRQWKDIRSRYIEASGEEDE